PLHPARSRCVVVIGTPVLHTSIPLACQTCYNCRTGVPCEDSSCCGRKARARTSRRQSRVSDGRCFRDRESHRPDFCPGRGQIDYCGYERGGRTTDRPYDHGKRREALFVKTDVTQATAVEALISRAVETYGRLDCAYNNAGISGTGIAGTHRALTADYPDERWHQVMAINLTGVWLCMKYEIVQMLTQGGGAIVNTASVAGLVGLPYASAYVASKHGVVGLTKTAALEYEQHRRNPRRNLLPVKRIDRSLVMVHEHAAC